MCTQFGLTRCSAHKLCHLSPQFLSIINSIRIYYILYIQMNPMSVHEDNCISKNVCLLLHVCCCLKSRTGLRVGVSLGGSIPSLDRPGAMHTNCVIWVLGIEHHKHKYWIDRLSLPHQPRFILLHYIWWTTRFLICKIEECIFDECICLHLFMYSGTTACTKCYVHFLLCYYWYKKNPII